MSSDSGEGRGPEDRRPPRGLAALLRRQAELQREAQAVLSELALPKHLGRVGVFEQVGSSASGLMVWRDLDVAARCSDPTAEEVFASMQPVLAHPGIRHVVYRPEIGSRSPSGRPEDQRYYFVLRYENRAGHLWKIDISLWRSGEARTLLFDAERLRRELSPETRGAILLIKDIWHRRSTYPDAVGAVEIYDAVLHHGVRNPEQFGEYLRARGMPTS